jgi:hypothetical protein
MPKTSKAPVWRSKILLKIVRIHIRLPKEPKLHIALSVCGLWKARGEEGSGLMWFEVLQQSQGTIIMFHTYVILLILQSILKGSFYNFRIMIRDIFMVYSRCMIAYSTPYNITGSLSVETPPVHQKTIF